MAQYRRREMETVEAAQYFNDGPDIPGVFRAGMFGAYVVTIHDQKVELMDGDWVVPEPDGKHYYPVKNDIFLQRYELVEGTSPNQAIDENFSHFLVYSGLGETGNVPSTQPSFVGEYIFPLGRMWIVGKSLGGSNHWEFQGVFDNEAAALRACPSGKPYFVAPATLNEVLPQATLTWKGLYWPALNTGDASSTARQMGFYDRA